MNKEDVLQKYPVVNKFTRKIAREYNEIIQSSAKLDTENLDQEALKRGDLSGVNIKMDLSQMEKANEVLVRGIFGLSQAQLDLIEEVEYQVLLAEAQAIINPLV